MGIARYQLLISGRVQGVGYRYATLQQAKKSGLIGWVKNLPTGQVEIVVEGEQETLKSLIDWAWQGPSFANVTAIDQHLLTINEVLSDFEIR